LGPPEKINMAAFADDLLAFFDELGIGQAVVGGISMGAAVAAAGLECVQLNLESAGLPPVPDEIPAELAARIRRAAVAWHSSRR
jgi:hypothetical protein